MVTRKTKKTGGNLHCIMAFKKLEDSSSGQMFISFDRPQKTAAARRRDIVDSSDRESTPSEDLESSDSDANDMEPKTEADVTSGPSQSREVWEASFRALTESITSQEQQVVIEAGSDSVAFEEVDAPPPQMQAREQSIDRLSENRNRRSGTFTKREVFDAFELQLPLVTEPALKPPHVSGSASAPDIQVESSSAVCDEFSTDRLKRTGTFTKKWPSLSPVKSDPTLSSDVGTAIEGTSLPDGASWASRTGTFKKKKPSLSPTAQVRTEDEFDGDLSPNVGAATEGAIEDTSLPDGASWASRTGTFKKKKPSLSPTAQVRTEDEFDGDLSPNVGAATESAGSTFEKDSPSRLKRSGTFKKEKPSLSKSELSQAARTQDYLSAELSHAAVEDTDSTVDDHTSCRPIPVLKLQPDYELASDEDVEPNPFVRKGTFTKKKAIKAKAYVKEIYTESDQDDSDLPKLNEPGLDDTLTNESMDLEPDLDDTLTNLTLEPPAIYVSASSDSEDSVEETLILTDDPRPSGTRVKRSGTFTKTKPTLPSW